MLGDLLERHRQAAILILSGFILFGSGISLGFGISQPMPIGEEVNYSGETIAPGEALPAPITEVNFPLNINTASAEELDELPGIGPSKAAAIIDYRTKNGIFQVKEDLQNVSGIGPQTFAELKSLIKVK